jgi:simple sugar transport system ATP-binding protein
MSHQLALPDVIGERGTIVNVQNHLLLKQEICNIRCVTDGTVLPDWLDGREDRVALLEIRNVAKHFGAIHAVSDVSLVVEPGEVVGLMGDNGAGKSTMVKLIAGNFPPTHGDVVVDGEVCHFNKPIEARAKGIEVVYQDLALADNLTASQNVFLGRELKKGFWPFRILDKKAMIDKSGELFQELKSETRPMDLVQKMSGGQRQAVAIARTRLSNAKLVIMDEPTAAISVRQVAEVLNLIHRLKSQGVAVMLISHRMPDVFAVCDRIIVMRRGTKVADKAKTQTSPEEITGLITGAIRAA